MAASSAAGQGRPLGGRKDVELRENEYLADDYARNRPEGVERLGEIQALRRRGLGSHGEYVGVGRGLQDRQPGEEDEDRERYITKLISTFTSEHSMAG